jgi:hypothetical protein
MGERPFFAPYSTPPPTTQAGGKTDLEAQQFQPSLGAGGLVHSHAGVQDELQ